MPDIGFMQYLRPDGRQSLVSIDRPDDVAEKARKIIDAGYLLECEMLTTGHISLTIVDPREEEDVAIRVVENGPKVPEAVDDMIIGFKIP